MVRLAVMGFMWDVSTPISLPLSAWLYNSGGYVCVMATSLLLYVIACLLGLLRLWNFKEKKKSSSATIWGRLSWMQSVALTEAEKLCRTQL